MRKASATDMSRVSISPTIPAGWMTRMLPAIEHRKTTAARVLPRSPAR